MIRKFAFSLAFAGLLALSVSAAARPISAQSQSNQQQSADAKTVSGKVTAIGSDHKSFSMDVNDSSGQARSMQFVLDQKTQVQGRVGTGTTAIVEYHPTQDGKNLAVNIAPASQQNPQ
ncbi:MAG TPA: hypothetical protein VHX49_10455 [Candidatus Acidoferrales bacterium]|jgi:hypothetical protein|nr:hypothetical protein [Candidatus Acidoferrales bacterium]